MKVPGVSLRSVLIGAVASHVVAAARKVRVEEAAENDRYRFEDHSVLGAPDLKTFSAPLELPHRIETIAAGQQALA